MNISLKARKIHCLSRVAMMTDDVQQFAGDAKACCHRYEEGKVLPSR